MYWRIIICLVYKTIYRRFIVTDTDKITASVDKEKLFWSVSFLCSLDPMFHFYCWSMGGEADSLTHQRQDTNHSQPPPTHKHTHTDTSLLSCILHDQRTSMWALWFEMEKMVLNQRTTNHRQPSSAPTITCRHVRIHTSQTELPGLCSHQCVYQDREREIVEGVRLSN